MTNNTLDLGAMIYTTLSQQNKIAALIYGQAPEQEKPPQELELQRATNKITLSKLYR